MALINARSANSREKQWLTWLSCSSGPLPPQGRLICETASWISWVARLAGLPFVTSPAKRCGTRRWLGPES